MGELRNLFSWSKSRDEQFRECQRKYYYDKYASWGGWDPSSPERTRLAYVLKNLKNRWAWKGETVHHVIEDVLKAERSGRPLTLEQSLERLTETMRRDFRSSKSRKNHADPKNHAGLFEHEYQKPVTDSTWRKLHDESVRCLRAFYASELYEDLRRDDKKQWLVIEDLEEFDLEGSKVYVKLDFARRKDGFVEIYDWKTGKADAGTAALQMGIYALYAMGRWGVGLEAIRGYLFNLSETSPRPEPCPVTEASLDETRTKVRESVAAMKALLANPDRNEPLPSESFRFTDNARLCDYCNFLKICEKYTPA